MQSEELRRRFYSFFEGYRHTVLPSSSLIPAGDQTLLFTNAGMVQFKTIFTGEEASREDRAVTIQKCVRAGGKHNDLENVGYTRRHHTFFEMMGNFSFGDYFKKDAIHMAWEFLTREVGLPPEKLWVTIYRDDDEAFGYWKNIPDLLDGRIVRLGEKDNFWQMGDTGPCGPCSEIIIDQGDEAGCGRPDCNIECGCDRFLELWNLVFMQFNRDETGKLERLPKPSIDTGMGLERISAVSQGKLSNYDSDLFTPLTGGIAEIWGVEYGRNNSEEGKSIDTAVRVVADHIRAVSFMISDGIMPSNEGRGYVLRRIIRRAFRYGGHAGVTDPFLHKLVNLAVDRMKSIYPELEANRMNIIKVTLAEEEKFINALHGGLQVLSELIEKVKGEGRSEIAGSDAFKLYDTFGIPFDMVTDIAAVEQVRVDADGFTAAMAEQKTRSKGQAKTAVVEGLEGFAKTEFTGYSEDTSLAKIAGIRTKDGRWIDKADREIGEITVILDKTPFYAESGGQTGDTGLILSYEGENKEGKSCKIEVINTKSSNAGVTLHECRILSGTAEKGKVYYAKINTERRDAVRKNHTGTHLLHHMLRKVLGGHVRQSGSHVSDERLRFDFTHFSSVSQAELEEIERDINRVVCDNIKVDTQVMEKDEAISKGAIAFFGDKYDRQVRVVKVGDISVELCGGTHLNYTGQTGLFKIISEGAVAAGIRRIEAVTGEAAYLKMKKDEAELMNTALILKTTPSSVADKADKLVAELKEKEREISSLRDKLGSLRIDELIEAAKKVGEIEVIAKNLGKMEMNDVRNLADKIRDKVPDSIIFLGAEEKDKAILFCSVADKHTAKYSAGDIIKKLSPIIEGGGGGNRKSGQAGGKNPGKLEEAVNMIYNIIKE